MRRFLLQMALLLVFGGWCTQASAYWEKNPEPITKASDLKAGMRVGFELRCGPDALNKLVTAPTVRYWEYGEVGSEHVFLLEDAGTNEWTGEPMFYLKSELTGKYFKGTDGFNSVQEDSYPITFTSAQIYTKMEKGEGWTEDEPVWPNETKTPQWDWKNGDAINLIYFESATQAYVLGQVWGWYWYPECWFSGFDPSASETEKTGSAINAWYAYEMTWIDDPLQDLALLVTKYTDAHYENIYVAGEGIGFTDPAAVQAYQDALAKANELLSNTEATDEELKAAGVAIESTYEAMKGAFHAPKDGGYYYVLSGFSAFEQKQGVKKAWYKDASAVKWTTLNRDNIAFLFKFIKQEDGSFAIQSVKDNTYLSGYTTVSNEITTTQGIFPVGEGLFYIINGAKATSGGADVYHAQSHSSGAGVSGALTSWYTGASASASSWTFEELTDLAKIDTMKAVEAQRLLTEAFNTQLAQARADSAAGYKMKRYITSVDQLSSNATETTEGSLANLLDDTYSTYFHSSWSKHIGQPHYLQVALNEPLQKFAVYYMKRHNNNNNRPVHITILASNDAEGTFTEVGQLPEAPDTLPTNASQTTFRSSKAVDLGAPYKYIRFRVDTTNNNALEPANADDADAARYPFFTFSEFNLSDEGFPIDPETSMAHREDMKEAYAALKAAIDEALTKDPATVTQADIDLLVAANEAFAKAYPDVSVLEDAISETNGYVENVSVVAPGVDPRMGQCTDESTVTAMSTAATAAAAALEANPKMTRAEIDAQVAKLDAANKAFFASVVMPEPGKWYFIQSMSTTTSYEALNTVVYATDAAVGAGLKWGGNDSEGRQDPKNLWKLIETGEEGIYNVQNVGTGLYFGAFRGTSAQYLLSDTAVAYKVRYVSGGQLTLQQAVDGALPIHAANGGNVVAWSASKDNGSVWTFTSTDEEQVAEASSAVNTAKIVCLPYDITGSFYAYNFDDDNEYEGEATAYTITDAKYDGDGNITSIGLSELEIDDVIPAGTPFILVVDDVNGEAGIDVKVDLGIVLEGNVTNEAKTDNGLVGMLASKAIDQAGIGYFDGGLKSLAEGKSVTIAGQTGYIDGLQVKASGEASLYIDVKGGVITEINQAIKDAKAVVTVYTADGQLVRKNVKAADALKGLKKGIYVVDGKVVSVK